MNGEIKRIYNQHWLELPKDVRDHLVKKLGIVRTGITEVRDQTVLSDGHTNDDLAVITKENLAEYVGSTGEFTHLWKVAVSKANFELHPPMQIKVPQSQSVASINSNPTTHAKIENKEVSKEEGNSPTSDTAGTPGATQVPTEGQPSEGGSTPALSSSGESR